MTGSFEISPWRGKKLCMREPVQPISAHCAKWHRENFTSIFVQNNSNLKKKGTNNNKSERQQQKKNIFFLEPDIHWNNKGKNKANLL